MPSPVPRARTGALAADPAARLAGLGSSLAGQPVGPRPEFREQLRCRLLAAAGAPGAGGPDMVGMTARRGARRLPARRRPARPPRSGRSGPRDRPGGALAVLAALTAVAVGTSGMTVAADRALPGNAFWLIKRAAEAVQLGLTSGDAARGGLELEFAASRLRELPLLLPGYPQTGGAFTQVLRLMDSETASGSRLLVGAAQATRDPAPLRTLSRFAAGQGGALTDLIPVLPPAVRRRAARSATVLLRLDQQAATLLVALARPLLPAEQPAGGQEPATTTPSGAHGVPARVRSTQSRTGQRAAPPTGTSPKPPGRPGATPAAPASRRTARSGPATASRGHQPGTATGPQRANSAIPSSTPSSASPQPSGPLLRDTPRLPGAIPTIPSTGTACALAAGCAAQPGS